MTSKEGISRKGSIKTDIDNEELGEKFTNSSWTCKTCLLEPWGSCDGPLDLDCYKTWNCGGIFDYESCNEMGWNGGQWPPR